MWAVIQTSIGGLLAIIGGFFGSRLNIQATNRRWEATEVSQHNRATAERLSRLYAPLVQSTATIQAISHERQFVTSRDGDVASRDARHSAELARAYKMVEEIGGELLIDADARPLREMYNQFRRTFESFMVESESGLKVPIDVAKVEQLRQKLGELAIVIQAAAEAQLELLNKPTILRKEKLSEQRDSQKGDL
jgi:hypothetical protein